MAGVWLRLCVALLVASGPAAAQDVLQVPSPILTLDQEALFNGSRAAERVSEEIARRTAELAAENRRIEADLEAEELELTERRPSLPPDEFRALADAFDTKVQGIRAAQDAKARELQRLRDEERQAFLRRITPILAEIVRERGAVAVLDRRSVFISAESIDITEEAITRINTVLEEEAAPTPEPDPGPEPDEGGDDEAPQQP